MKWLSSLLSVVLVAVSLSPVALAENTEVPAKQASLVKKSEDFKDLKGLPQEVKDKLDELLRDNVFDGVSDTVFGVDDKMNRAQFAKVAAIIFALPINKALTKSSFTDVRSDDPANGYALPFIEALKAAGLTNGVDEEGKLYNPSGTVTRQELAAFLIRGLKWKDAGVTPTSDSTVDDWAKSYITLALENKLMTQVAVGSFGGKVASTRKTLALASFEARRAVQTAATPVAGGTAAAASTALPAGITVLPTSIQLDMDKTSTLSVGDKYYDADGRISTVWQPPVIGLKVGGPNNYEFSASQIETLYSNGYIEVSASGGIVLDNPAIGQSSVGLGKVVIKEVTAEGDASVSAKLTHINDVAVTHTTQVKAMRIPTSIEVNSKEMVVLAENDQPQSFIFNVKDQYGKIFNAASSLDSSSYMINYKLERISGEPGLQSAGGIFTTPWDEQKLDAAEHVQSWKLPIEQGGDMNKFMFKPNHKPVGPEGSEYTITATVINKNTAQEIASAASNLKVYNWKDLDPKMTYEVDVNGSHFAAGKYLFERKLLTSEDDIATLNAKYSYYGKEVNIIATDDKNRRIDITKVLKDDSNNPISIVQSITANKKDTLIGAPGINVADIPVYKVYGIQPMDLFDMDVTFQTPNGVKKLTKRQLSIEYAEPATKAVALKNIALSFNLNTVYEIRKLDGTIEKIKGSDYLESKPNVWEFLKFGDNNGQDTKDESQFFRYFIQSTDQFGYKYQNTSDNKTKDFTNNLDLLKMKVIVDTEDKNPPKWSVKDEAAKDKIWIDDQLRIHYEPHAKKADGSFDYSKKNLQSFSIELVSPTLQRSWCIVTLNY
ncbi:MULTISPECIES: S-layer homology domain-containing protein [unclassified Paenibacillus]|uniref:S-layer homology domain-containing protein n=1 Tax=unclassified Paenibacillus TaxID=185978 RepID=UPI00362937B6